MYSKIIVGHNLNEGGDDALALGRAIASATGAELVVAKIFPLEVVPYAAGADWREREEQAVADLVGVADIAGAKADVLPSTSTGRGLYELAEETGADLIVIGSSRRGALEQVLVGNVGLRLLHGARCAVAVAPRGHRERGGHLRRITVGYDGSEEARLALSGAFELASATGAHVSVVAVAEAPPIVHGNGPGAQQGWAELERAIKEEAGRSLDEALAAAPEDINVDATLVTGDPAAALADSADTDGGLLVVGSRGYGPVKRVLLGSVSAELVRSARCPVLVLPRGVNDAEPTAVGASSGSAGE